MKLEMAYIAIDADNVGEKIGNAVLSNDEAQLSDLSQSINSGIGIFSQWAEGAGGKVISSGSDEAVLKVPTSDIEKIDEIREAYRSKTGFSISIGIGNTVSEAAKALIYAKVNGKDQTVDYSPEIERAMQQAVSGNVQQLEGGVGDETDPEELPQDELEEGVEHEKEHTDDEDVAEEIATDHLAEDDDYYSDLDEMESKDEEESGEETKQIEVPADEVDGDYGSEEMEEGQPEHEKKMGEEEEFIHDAQENRDDEADDDIIEADMEDEMAEEGEEALDELAEDIAEDMEEDSTEDIDLDGQPDIDEEHGNIEEENDIDGDGDIEHEEAMAAEEGQEEEYTDEGDFDDEIMEEPSQELYEENDMGEKLPEEMGEDIGELEEEGQSGDSSLKEIIYESLQNFKENKEFLDSLAQSNPDLYGSLIYCLQAMIEMAKELGYGSMDEELPEEMGEEEVVSQEEMEDEPLSEDGEEFEGEDEDADFEDEEEEKTQFQKNEKFVSLLKKINSAFDMLTMNKDEEVKGIQELKEEFKKKIKEKVKSKVAGSSKKKKVGAKKPSKDKNKKDKKESKDSNEGSFCARSHQKMRASGKDCRANEDKNSPLCSARRKNNCRGKNAEKSAVQKSEKLESFLKKKKKESELDKSRFGPTKQTTKPTRKPQRPVGALNLNREEKVENEEGRVKDVDVSRGKAKGPDGKISTPEGPSTKAYRKPKSARIGKV